MSTSYTAVASLYRSTNKDRMEIAKIGFRSDGTEGFATDVDFSDATNYPNLPMSCVSPNINDIQFLSLICTGGGTATVRLISGNNVGKFIDVPLTNGSLLLSGTHLTGVVVVAVEGLGYLEVKGAGIK